MSNVRAGLVALAVAAIALYAVFSPHVPGRHGTRIRAVFSSSNELATGSPVRIAGVEVGKVTDVARGPGQAATVTMDIADRGLPIHADAQVAIRPRIILEGNFFVDLQPGTPGTRILHDGDRIPLSQTRIPVQLEQVLSTLDHPTRGDLQTLVAAWASALSRGGADAIRSTIQAAPPALRDVAVAAQAARGRAAGDLQAALRDSGALTSALALRDRELRALVPAYAATAQTLAAAGGDLARALHAAAPLVARAPADAHAADALLTQLDAAVPAARPALQMLPALTRDALPALRQADALLSDGEAGGLARDLAPALRTLGAAQPALRTLLARVSPVSACTRDVILPTLKAKVPDGRLSVDQPVWQQILHLATSLASASQNFDGNGPAARFHAGYGEGFVSLGDNPTVGETFATQSFVGSRPAWLGPGSDPPFRPDAPCTDEQPPSLEAPALGAPAQRRIVMHPTAAQLLAIRRAWHAIAKAERR